MAAYLKTVTMKVDLRLDDRTNRVIAALDANKGVLLPTINQLMAEAWAEGAAEQARCHITAVVLSANPYEAKQ